MAQKLGDIFSWSIGVNLCPALVSKFVLDWFHTILAQVAYHTALPMQNNVWVGQIKHQRKTSAYNFSNKCSSSINSVQAIFSCVTCPVSRICRFERSAMGVCAALPGVPLPQRLPTCQTVPCNTAGCTTFSYYRST